MTHTDASPDGFGIVVDTDVETSVVAGMGRWNEL